MFYRELLWAQGVIPKLDKLTEQLASTPTVFYSADGKVLYRAQAEYRKPAKFDEIPKHVRDATLAAEDVRFYEHQGVDFRGILRALFTNVREGRTVQGGSTVTMQLAKRLYTGEEKTFNRKLKDMALAVQIERSRTKDQILTMYLNQVYYGAGAYGIGAAASVYFGKSLKDLTLAEAALLARLVQRPSENNPFKSPDRALANRSVVLRRMRDSGMISSEEFESADSEPLRLSKRSFGSGARTFQSHYFVDYVLDTLRRELPDTDLTGGGYKVYTTIDSRLDSIAQKKVAEVVRKYRRQGLTTGAFVLVDDEGRILSMVGGADYERNNFNVVFQGHRQPGSAFKPFVYATALTTGAIGPRDSISNEPFFIDDPARGRKRWPKNANGKYGGMVSPRTALASSINVPAVRVCDAAGPNTVASYAHSAFGFRSPLDPVLALALGSSAVTPLEMAQGYGVFLLGGDRMTPFGITKVVGPDGNVIREFEPKIHKGVLDPQVCSWMDEFLRATITGGTATRARSIADARGKTGTTSDYRDAWFCGYTNSMVGIGWVASERRQGNTWVYDPMRRVYGGHVTIEIWVGVMKEAVKLYADRERSRERRKYDMLEPELPPPAEPPIDDAGGGEEALPIAQAELHPTPETAAGESAAAAANGAEGTSSEAATGGSSAPVRPSEPGGVPVEVCADSGLRAGPYCPETVTRTYSARDRPRRRCPIHGP